jgi:hypothetical protein
MSVIVDVRERGRDAGLIRQGQASLFRDVLKAPAAEISPKLALAELSNEVEVHSSITIHIRDRDAIPVIVMGRLPVLAGVIDDLVFKGDAALRDPIGELKIMECPKGFDRLRLLEFSRRESLEQLRIGFLGMHRKTLLHQDEDDGQTSKLTKRSCLEAGMSGTHGRSLAQGKEFSQLGSVPASVPDVSRQRWESFL